MKRRRSSTFGPRRKQRRLCQPLPGSPAHSSDEEDEGPKKAHLHACLLEFLATTDVEPTVDAFVAHWDRLSLNAFRSPVSQNGPDVCPSPGDVRRFLGQSRRFRATAADRIAALPDWPATAAHHVCGVVLLKDAVAGPLVGPRKLVERYSARPDAVETRAGTAHFDLVVEEATHSEGAIYGVFAEAVVQRAATRLSGAVFIHGQTPLFERLVPRALTTLFTHRPLCHRQYVVHWAHLRYAVVPPPPTNEGQTVPLWDSTSQATFVLCDDLAQRVVQLPVRALESASATTLHWRNATAKAQVLQGHRLVAQQRRQHAVALRQADAEFEALAGPHPTHRAVVVRVLSRAAHRGGPFRPAYLVLVDADTPDALALLHAFPCSANACWLLGVRGGRCPATDHRLWAAAQVRAALRPLAAQLEGVRLPAVDAEHLADEQLLLSPAPHRRRISFSAQPLRRGSGYNAVQCRAPGAGTARPASLLRPPSHTLQPLRLLRATPSR